MERANNVVFVQKVFLLNDRQEVLIVKRQNEEVYNGYWDVPGGKLADGVSLVAGSTHKVRSETGLDLKRVMIIISSSRFEGVAHDAPTVIRNIYLATAEGTVRLDHKEHSEYRWVPVPELADLPFPPDADLQAALLKIPEIISNLDPGKRYSLLF